MWKAKDQRPIELEIKRRKLKWIGHILRQNKGAIQREAFDCNLQGVKRRGRPKDTWRNQLKYKREGEVEVNRIKSNKSYMFCLF